MTVGVLLLSPEVKSSLYLCIVAAGEILTWFGFSGLSIARGSVVLT